MKNLTITITLLITSSIFGQNENKFSLSGKTKNIENGTVLLLQNPLSLKFIDSVKVIDNSFVIKTQMSNFPSRVILWKDSSTAKSIWVENKNMYFDSTNSDFENAIIIGSATDSLATSLRNECKKLKSYDEIVSYELEFIKNNPNSILSAHNLSIMASVFGKEESKNLFNKFSTKNKESQYGKIISDFLTLKTLKAPQIGEKYIDFYQTNPTGKQEKLSELDGKYILVEFWASWCKPCREENPELIKVYNKFKGFDFEIFAVSLDENKEDWTNAIQKDNLTWKHVTDLKGRNNRASLIYAVNGIPDNILIDKNGIIIARNLRSDKLELLLSELLLPKEFPIKEENGKITFRLSNLLIWKDENGAILTELEGKKMLETNKYIPHLDTEKKIMVLKKIAK